AVLFFVSCASSALRGKCEHASLLRFASREIRAECGREAWPLRRRSRSGGANVAVAQVRGLLCRQRILVLERGKTVRGKGRHPGSLSRFQPDLVELGGVAAEDQLLGVAVGAAERRKPVFLLHVF